MTEEQIEAEAIRIMEEYGGSFAKALAKAYICADPDNRERIRKGFPELLDKYKTWVVVCK